MEVAGERTGSAGQRHCRGHGFQPNGLRDTSARWARFLTISIPMSILVVDDDPEVRTTISIILEQNGYLVLEAVDGKDALRQARDKTVSLIIIDLFMPNMDGLETIRELRRLPRNLPILAISGSSAQVGVPMPDLPKAAVAFGAVSTLPKPFKASELLNAVRSVISKSSSSQNHLGLERFLSCE